jgi:hypothetical protein
METDIDVLVPLLRNPRTVGALPALLNSAISTMAIRTGVAPFVQVNEGDSLAEQLAFQKVAMWLPVAEASAFHPLGVLHVGADAPFPPIVTNATSRLPEALVVVQEHPEMAAPPALLTPLYPFTNVRPIAPL